MSEWVRERENTVCEEFRIQWLAVDLKKEFDSPVLQGLFHWFWHQQWLLGDLSGRQICLSVKLTSYFCLVPKLKCLLYMQPLCVFYIQSSLTLCYLTTYKIISIYPTCQWLSTLYDSQPGKTTAYCRRPILRLFHAKPVNEITIEYNDNHNVHLCLFGPQYKNWRLFVALKSNICHNH